MKSKSVPPASGRCEASLTSAQASDIRARAWAYIFGCYEKHKGASESNSTDTTRADNLHMREGG